MVNTIIITYKCHHNSKPAIGGVKTNTFAFLWRVGSGGEKDNCFIRTSFINIVWKDLKTKQELDTSDTRFKVVMFSIHMTFKKNYHGKQFSS